MEAEDDNQDGEVEEEPLVPDDITDEYFDGLILQINGVSSDYLVYDIFQIYK